DVAVRAVALALPAWRECLGNSNAGAVGPVHCDDPVHRTSLRRRPAADVRREAGTGEADVGTDRAACHGNLAEFLSGGFYVVTDAVLPSLGTVGVDEVIRHGPAVSRGGRRAAGDQPRRLTAECAGQCGVISVFLCAGTQHLRSRKKYRGGFFVFRFLRADDSIPLSRILCSDSQRTVDAVHARADEPLAK